MRSSKIYSNLTNKHTLLCVSGEITFLWGQESRDVQCEIQFLLYSSPYLIGVTVLVQSVWCFLRSLVCRMRVMNSWDGDSLCAQWKTAGLTGRLPKRGVCGPPPMESLHVFLKNPDFWPPPQPTNLAPKGFKAQESPC